MNNNEINFNIRSKECTQIGSLNTNLIVILPITIEIPEHSICEMTVVSAEIPLSFYNISLALQNNVFSYYISGNPTLQNITIDDGNYTVDSMIFVINDSQSYFTMTYDETFNKILITLISPAYDLILLYGVNNYNNQLFGVYSNQLITSVDYLNGVVNLASVHSLNIRAGLGIGSTISTSNSNSDIIQKVPLQVNPYGIIIHNSNNYIQKNYIKSGVIKSFNLSITEQNQKLLDLNGCVYELSMLFKIIPDDSYISEEQRNNRRNRLNTPLIIQSVPEVSTFVPPEVSTFVPPEVSTPIVPPPITLDDIADELLLI